MKIEIFSYRYAEEIIQHERHGAAWNEIHDIFTNAPLFVWPGKSDKNKKLDVVQQVMNTYFDRVFSKENGWVYHPLATEIPDSNLRADYRKKFEDLSIQAEIQFGNMARWYSDIFKFQTAYSQRLAQVGLSVVPMTELAGRIDSNVVNFERAVRELPSAELSITLPVLMIGLAVDGKTNEIDLSKSQFRSVKELIGRGQAENRWRIVEGYIKNVPIDKIGPSSPTGAMLSDDQEGD